MFRFCYLRRNRRNEPPSDEGETMACDPEELRHVPLFELLNDEQAQFLCARVEIRKFAARQRIFKEGEGPLHGYVLMSGSVRVTTTDEDKQEVVVDEPGH